MSAKLMSVIMTDMECRGKGIEDDPCRRITQYWSVAGELLAEVDPCPAKQIGVENNETCKWRLFDKTLLCPHDTKEMQLHRTLQVYSEAPYCQVCAKRIEVIK